MYISESFNSIPELAHLDEATFIQDCKNILNSPNQVQAFNAYSISSGMGPYLPGGIVRGSTQERNDLLLLPLPKRVRIEVKIERKPYQRLVKHVRFAWWFEERDDCFANDFHFPLQFMGYGSYSLCHYNYMANPAPITGFFTALQEKHVNLHRTFVFTNGTYEIPSQPTVPLLLIDPGNKANSTVHPDFLKNIVHMANAARARQVVLQVCLFPRQSIAGSPHVPLPTGLSAADLGGTGHAAISNFFKVGGKWQPMQERIIDGLAKALVSHWNVVWEVGNELFVPNPTATYGEAQLREWVNWAADRIRRKTYGKLVTVSGSRGNEPQLCPLATLDFASFHRGQWDPTVTNNVETIEKARLRCANSYGDKHLVIDDDGTDLNRGNAATVKNWAISALTAGGVGPCSFNHKGAYNPMSTIPFGDSCDELNALGEAWEEVFQPLRPGVGIMVPRLGGPIPV